MTNKDKFKIMLVEDDLIDVLTIKRSFAKMGLSDDMLIVLRHGQQVLDYFSSDTNEVPHIILLDLKMPGISGLELLGLLKKDERLKLIPVIVLTTSSAESDKLDSYKLSVAGYFVKPIDYFKITEVIYNYWTLSELPVLEKY